MRREIQTALKVFTLAVAVTTAQLAGAVELRLYGGDDHATFLGILNASKFDVDSIWNSYGTYGSKYNEKSIWNKYGNYGGEYSNNSPFSRYASLPPIIVDSEGNSYGYLSVNEYQKQRAQFSLAVIVCSMWESAYDDLEKVYELAKDHFNPNLKASRVSTKAEAIIVDRVDRSDGGKSLTVTMQNVTTILEGCKLFSGDGKFLGTITWNDVASDSIFNSVGRFGSDISSTSIWNDISDYGSDTSSQSAFNDIASDPPRIVKNGRVIGYLTTNDAKAGAVSTKLLLGFVDDTFDKMYRKRLLGL